MSILLISTFFGSLLGRPQAVEQPEPQPEVRIEKAYEVKNSYIGQVTAYSSREEETDDTPFVTASGEQVRWGIVATNAYPFGTKVRFPEIYGDKVFVVKDRMHSRYQNRIDIWFPEYDRARLFGLKNTKVEIVDETEHAVLSLNK